MKRISVLIYFLALNFCHLHAQDSVQVQLDSIEASESQEHLSQTLQLIQRADSIHTADSIQKLVLRKQLEELSEREQKKRRELESRLQSLNQEDSIKRESLKREIDSVKHVTKGFPVVPYKDTLFFIYTKIGSIAANERAKIITDRLKDLYAHFLIRSDSLDIDDYGQTVDIHHNEKLIISITELDALWLEKSKLHIAQEYKAIILKDIAFYKEETSFIKKVKLVGYTLLAILGQILLAYLINLFFRKKVDQWIIAKKDVLFTGIKIKNYQILDSVKQTEFLLFFSKALKLFLILFMFYIALPLTFIIFPPTQRFAEVLFGYIITPVKSIVNSFIAYLPNLFTVIIIVTVTRYLLRFVRYLALEVEYGNLKIQGFYADWAKPTFSIVKVVVYAFMFITIFPYLPGSDSDVFKGVSVFLGVIFSLGSTSVIGNLVAGLVMTYMRPFVIGDRIKINDTIGDVVEKTAFVTRIRTPKKEFVTIPNSNILSSSVVNYSTSRDEGGIVLHSTVTIGYDVPWRKVHELLINAALKTQFIINEPSPFVLQTSLDDFYVSYQINAYSSAPNRQPGTYSELHQHIQDLFNEAGIEIMSPHYRAPRDGNQTTIPAEYLPKDYEAPFFRVKKEEGNNKE